LNLEVGEIDLEMEKVQKRAKTVKALHHVVQNPMFNHLQVVIYWGEFPIVAQTHIVGVTCSTTY
jgi:pantothenate kinase